MKVIKDRTEGEWVLEVNLPSIDRVRAGADVNLVDVGEETPLLKLFEDYPLAAHVLYWLLYEESEKRKLAKEDFLRLWDGESLEQAIVAIVEETINFFPRRMQPAFREQLHRMKIAMDEAEKTIERINKIPGWEAVLKKKMAEAEQEVRKIYSDAASSPSPGN